MMRSHQLLVVVWQKDIREQLGKLLSNNSYIYDIADSPTKALDAIHKYTYKLVIVDSLLTGLNGYQLVKRMKNTPHGGDAKFIVLMNDIPETKYDDVKKRWGVFGLIKKSVSENDFISLIKIAETYELPSEKLEKQQVTSVEEVLSELAHILWTGKTSFYKEGGIIKEIYWDAGNPVFAISNNDDDRFDKWLVNQGIASASTIDAATDIMNKTGKKIDEALIMLGAINDDTREQIVSDYMKGLIVDMFSWEKAEYTKEEKHSGIKELTSIKEQFPIILFEGINAKNDIGGIKEGIEKAGGIAIFTVDNIFNVENFKFPSSFNRIMNLINGKRTVYELIAKSGIIPEDGYKFIRTLFLLKIIDLKPSTADTTSGLVNLHRIQANGDRKTKFIGNLHDISISELIQMLELNRKSGAMQINDGHEIGWLLFDKGKIIDAYYGDITHESAAYRILCLTDGEFDIKFKDVVGEPRINTDTQTILMEGLRLLDEIRRLEPMVGDLKKRFKINQEYNFNTEEEKEEISRIFNGKNDILTSAFLLNPNPQQGFDIISTLQKSGVIKEL
ncbi:MAG: DUF4388 domain-containing protein [Deltaproteobacteria bacterium]|nr:DUF4388 domain-containing protein [Deltaproteobacteria bacterium]MCL5791930.1 DUF4388 domain-containing protein [Deltaproteobacteria bacterium]